MVGGAWLGNELGFTGAVLHILNDALMTFALFLVLGNLLYRLRSVDFQDIQGVFARMPWTMAACVLAGLSIIGVPPTCGFFSKWYLVLAGLEAGAYHFVAALILSSLVCAVLFFRIIEIGFFETPAESMEHQNTLVREAPVCMLIPLGLVSVSLLAVGLSVDAVVQGLIAPFLGLYPVP
jgi:multicomponent Na+:H+ antiporter subunit D